MKRGNIWRPVWMLVLVMGLISCSQEGDELSTVIEGQFEVADSVDASDGLSGIEFTIIHRDSTGVDADTIYQAVTDSTGRIIGTAKFPEKQFYRGFVSRNEKRVGEIAIILADNDTVSVKATLPGVGETVEIESGEHEALDLYRNVTKNFNRVRSFAAAGSIPRDSLPGLLNKWSDVYWQLYEKHEKTLAGKMAAAESVRILSGWDREEMMSRIRGFQDEDRMVDVSLTYAPGYLAEKEGLDRTISYLDTLQKITDDQQKITQIRKKRIELLYDSARIEQAENWLESFKKDHSDNREVRDWIRSMSYDLRYMAPGDTLPSFSFTSGGREISNESLKGRPYILEITGLTNALYQEQYSRTAAIYSVYKNYGLEVVTLPLDQDQVTVDAFFGERGRSWPVADAGAFDREKLTKRFNIRYLPTRFLVNRKGQIARKYVGREYEDIVQGIQTLMENIKAAS